MMEYGRYLAPNDDRTRATRRLLSYNTTLSDKARRNQWQGLAPGSGSTRPGEIDEAGPHIQPSTSSEQREWDRQAERFGGFEVDDELKLRGLLDRQVGWLFALENLAGIEAPTRKASP
jgi:hypothetical protein